jgi:hypothetical protein
MMLIVIPVLTLSLSSGTRRLYYISSHLLPHELAMAGLTELLTLLRQWYTEVGFAQLRYQLIWEDGLPYPQSDAGSAL